MFEEEYRKSGKIYVTVGTTILRNKNYYPQVSALIDNYRSCYSISKDEYHTMIKSILKWSDDKINRITNDMLSTGVLVDTNIINETFPIYYLMEEESSCSIKKDSYILGMSLNNLCRKEDKDCPPLVYEDHQVKYVTIDAETMFRLLEERNDLLFKVYAYFKMNQLYWNNYKNTPFNFYIKGKGGAVDNLGFSIRSGSAADRIRECVEWLEKNNYIVLGAPISRGKKYGKFLGYYRPLYDVREYEAEPMYSDYTLVRVPNMCFDRVTDIIYEEMINKGFPESVPERLIFDI